MRCFLLEGGLAKRRGWPPLFLPPGWLVDSLPDQLTGRLRGKKTNESSGDLMVEGPKLSSGVGLGRGENEVPGRGRLLMGRGRPLLPIRGKPELASSPTEPLKTREGSGASRLGVRIKKD
ncbi:manganese peroxidase 2 [Sesbania bispinosa]|nr:manganese peroxidase 2 [Sesbania bispinosa]